MELVGTSAGPSNTFVTTTRIALSDLGRTREPLPMADVAS